MALALSTFRHSQRPPVRRGKKSHPGGVPESASAAQNLASSRDAGATAHTGGVVAPGAPQPPATFWHPAGMTKRGVRPFSYSTENSGVPHWQRIVVVNCPRQTNLAVSLAWPAQPEFQRFPGFTGTELPVNGHILPVNGPWNLSLRIVPREDQGCLKPFRLQPVHGSPRHH